MRKRSVINPVIGSNRQVRGMLSKVTNRIDDFQMLTQILIKKPLNNVMSRSLRTRDALETIPKHFGQRLGPGMRLIGIKAAKIHNHFSNRLKINEVLMPPNAKLLVMIALQLIVLPSPWI